MKDQSVGKKITINNSKTDWPTRLAVHVRSSITNPPARFRPLARTQASRPQVQTMRERQQSKVLSQQQ